MPQHTTASWANKLRTTLADDLQQSRQDALATATRENEHIEPRNDRLSASPMEVEQQLEEPPSPTPLESTVPESAATLSDVQADMEDIVAFMLKWLANTYEDAEPDEKVWERLSREVKMCLKNEFQPTLTAQQQHTCRTARSWEEFYARHVDTITSHIRQCLVFTQGPT